MKILPSLKQLEYLAALDDEVHFGKAADRCNVTPSTLSAGIRDLEGVLNIPLAERTKRSVMITPLGSQIAERAKRLLQDAEEIMALASSANRASLEGDLSLGLIPTIGPFLLPRVLPNLWKTYPKLRMVLHEEKTSELLEKLRRGEMDVILIALPYDTSGLETKILFEDDFVLACPPFHPLAKQKTVSTDDLANVDLLLLKEGHCLRGHALQACRLEHRLGNGEFAATSLHTLVQMVAVGMGVTLLPKLAIDGGVTARGDLKIVPLANPASRQIGLVWRASSYRRVEFELLGECLLPLSEH